MVERKSIDTYKVLAMVMVGVGFLVLGLVALMLIPKSGAAEANEPPSAIPMEVNYQAPELDLADLHGADVSLQDYLGQVVLVNNWATWCPPCKAEMPVLQTYYEDHRHQDFMIIAIEAGDPVFEVADFVKQYGLTFSVWPDPTQKATVAFRNPGLPSSYVIDRVGKVRLAWTGAISQEMLEKYVTPLIEE